MLIGPRTAVFVTLMAIAVGQVWPTSPSNPVAVNAVSTVGGVDTSTAAPLDSPPKPAPAPAAPTLDGGASGADAPAPPTSPAPAEPRDVTDPIESATPPPTSDTAEVTPPAPATVPLTHVEPVATESAAGVVVTRVGPGGASGAESAPPPLAPAPPPTTPATQPAPSTTAPVAPVGAPASVGAVAYGFAEAAGLSGGVGGQAYVVTSPADSGPGTYRDAVSAGGRYITFAPALEGATITLRSAVRAEGSNITLDGSTARVTITGFATKFSGTNIVVAGLTFADMNGSGNEDALTFRDASTDQIFGLYGNTFRTATDGLVDIIWNRGHDVYATVCGNRFEHHDKAMLVHSGDDAREGGRYHITLCRNLWSDVYQRAPFTRDALVHQYNDVFLDYGKPDGAGGGSKAGQADQRSQHFVENSVARPRAQGSSTWTGAEVTKPRLEFAGPQLGNGGSIRITGTLQLSNGGAPATQIEQRPGDVFSPGYSYSLSPADDALLGAVTAGAGTCPPANPGSRSVNPCGGLLGR